MLYLYFKSRWNFVTVWKRNLFSLLATWSFTFAKHKSILNRTFILYNIIKTIVRKNMNSLFWSSSITHKFLHYHFSSFGMIKLYKNPSRNLSQVLLLLNPFRSIPLHIFLIDKFTYKSKGLKTLNREKNFMYSGGQQTVKYQFLNAYKKESTWQYGINLTRTRGKILKGFAWFGVPAGLMEASSAALFSSLLLVNSF